MRLTVGPLWPPSQSQYRKALSPGHLSQAGRSQGESQTRPWGEQREPSSGPCQLPTPTAPHT